MINAASLTPTLASRPTTAVEDSERQLCAKIWGVRGSVPTPTLSNQRYGGNTVCVEVLLGKQRIIFDGGTGLVGLGDALQTQRDPIQAHIFFTHTQWDRIQGFPFFQPAFNPQNQFSIYGGTAPNGASIKHCLTDQMLKPHFSMPLQHMQANLNFNTLVDGDKLHIEDIAVEVLRTRRATEAFGYRLTWQNRTLVYATDTPTGQINSEILQLADQADILIYDGTYSDLSYLYDRSKTHPQPWTTGTQIAEKAGVKQLVLLHHSPVQNDAALDELQVQVRGDFPNTLIAKEGMSVSC